MTLTAGQEKAKQLVEQGNNVYVGGAGGTGKSFLMREITDNNTLLCAPTGAAALQIGGMTTSSLFGLPIGVCLDSDRFKPARKAEELFANGLVKRIILDEGSMCRADQFSLIDAKLRNITKKDQPFGGVQMVIVGDLYQLPPIVAKPEMKVFKSLYKSPWLFNTMTWDMAEIKTVALTEVLRQEDEKQVRILQSIRAKDQYWGAAVDRINEISLQRPIDAVWLCSYNNTVEMLNKSRYNEIQAKEVVITGVNKGFKPHELPVDLQLRLKKGCRVLIKANCKDGTYVNGTQGFVEDFIDENVIVKTVNGDSVVVSPFEWTKYEYVAGMHGMERKKVASFKQVPIKLGYAISIHSSQGSTLDSANIDLGRGAFSAGQTYVALSRVKDLTKMYIQGGIQYSDIIVDPEVKQFYESLEG